MKKRFLKSLSVIMSLILVVMATVGVFVTNGVALAESVPTYYVASSADGGSDSNNGLTASAPLLTIKEAVIRANASYSNAETVVFKTVGSGDVSTGLGTSNDFKAHNYKLIITANDPEVPGTIAGTVRLNGEVEFINVTMKADGDHSGNGFTFNGFSTTFGENAYLGAVGAQNNAVFLGRNYTSVLSTSKPTNIKISTLMHKAFYLTGNCRNTSTYNYPVTIEIDNWTASYNDEVHGGFYFSYYQSSSVFGNTVFNAPLNIKVDKSNIRLIFKAHADANKFIRNENFAFQLINSSGKDIAKTGDTLTRNDSQTAVHTDALEMIDDSKKYIIHNATGTEDVISFTSEVGKYQVNVDPDITVVATSLENRKEIHKAVGGTTLTLPAGEYRLTSEKTPKYATYYIKTDLDEVVPAQPSNLSLDGNDATTYNADSTRDDAPYIQNLVDTAVAGDDGIKVVEVPEVNPNDPDGGSTYQIGTTIVLPSNTTIKLNNCTLRLNDGVLCNVFASEGLHTTGATVDDELQNIKIIGVGDNATLDGGKHNGVFEGGSQNVRLNHFIWFKNVDGFEISNLKMIEQRHWAICFNFCENGKVFDIEFDCNAYSDEARNQDGIDLRNGCNNIEIYNITGNTGDDTIALTTLKQNDNDKNYRVSGKSFDIHDINIHDIYAGVNGGHGVIRLLAHNGCKIYNVDIKNVVDQNTHTMQGVIRIGDTNYAGSGTPMAYGDINNITIDGVISYAHYAIYVGNPNVTSEHVTYNNIKAPTGSTPKYTNLTIADPVVPLSNLEGTTIYKIDSTDAASGVNNFNAKLKNNSAKNVNLNYSVTVNGVSGKYAIYPLGTELTAPLQIWTSNFAADTTAYDQVRAQIRIAEEYENDPSVNDLALYYSTDNGTTWSTNPISLTKEFNGKIASYTSGSTTINYNVWTFTSVNLNYLTNKPITNLKICPHGEQTLIRGAFRLISMDVKGIETTNYDPTRDDAPYIQSLIDAAVAGDDGIKVVNVPSINPADNTNTYQIGSAIEIPSNTTIYLKDCTLRLIDDVLTNVFISEGLYTNKNMTAADELQNIKIIGNGNVVIDGGNHNGVTEKSGTGNVDKNSPIWFRNVSGFEISGLKFIEQRYWAIRFNFCDNGKVFDIDFDCNVRSETAPNQDGIDLRNGCHDIEIYNITGNTGDDTVALTNLSFNEVQMEVEGKSNDIYNVQIHDVTAAVNGPHSLIRLLAQHGNKVYNVDIWNITDVSTTQVQGCLRIGDTNYVGDGTAMRYGDITRVTVNNVYSKGQYAIYAPNWNVTTDHVKYNNITVAQGCKYVYLHQAGSPAALAPLTGTTIYKYNGGDTTSITHNSNDIRPWDVVLNDVPTKYTLWPLGPNKITNNAALQMSTPGFAVDTTDFDDVRIQVQAAELPGGNDPSLQNLSVYYSTDNGATWSAEPIALKRTFHGNALYLADEANYGTACDVWSFTSDNIRGLTDKDITNLKVCPYGQQDDLVAGAFRLISIDVVGRGNVNEVGKGDGSFEKPFATVAEAIAAANFAGFVEGDFVTAIVVGQTTAEWGTPEAYTFNLTVKSYDNDNLSTVNTVDRMTGNVEFSNIKLDTPNNRILADGHSVTMGENVSSDGWVVASAQEARNQKAQTITYKNNNQYAIHVGYFNRNSTIYYKDVNYVLDNKDALFSFQFMGTYGGTLAFRKNLNFNVKSAGTLEFLSTTIAENAAANVWAGSVVVDGAAQIIMPYNIQVKNNTLENFKTIENHYIIKHLNTTVEDLLSFIEEAAGEYEVKDDFVVAAYNENDERIASSVDGFLDFKDENLESGTYYTRLVGAYGHNLCDDIRDLVYVNEVMEGVERGGYTELVDKDNTYTVTDEDKEIMHQELLTGKKYFPVS